MRHIKSRLLAVMIPLSLVPMLLVGMVSYLISTHSLQEKINDASMLTLNQASLNIEAKTERIAKYMDILFGSKEVQETLADVDFVHQNGETFMAYCRLDPMITSLFYKDADVRSASIFSQSGGAYMYKGYLQDEAQVRRTDWYGRILAGEGRITWAGIIDNPDALNRDKTVFAVGRLVRDTSVNKSSAQLGVAVLLLDKEFLSGNLADEKAGQGATVIVSDETGRLMLSAPGAGEGTLQNYVFGADVMRNATGSLRQNVDGVDTLVTYTTIPSTRWKVVRMIPYGSLTQEVRSIGWVTFLLAFACLAAVWLLSFAQAGRISVPLKNLAGAMKRVGDRDFNVTVPVQTRDEVGLICAGFNTMVAEIQQLFNAVVEEEKEKRKISLRSLQYQINPHFLYNTLSSVRFLALSEKSENVADMIMVLGRLLRKTINKAGGMVTVREELENLRDYISLQQIRYKNRLGVSIEPAEDILCCSAPGMLLQPLVENSIEHGLANALAHYSRECLIRISAFARNGELCFEIWDNGEGMSEKQIMDIFRSDPGGESDDMVHIGIKNIHDRLRFQFGPQYGITVDSVQNEYTCMRMNLPLIAAGEAAGHV